jgi:hypothetical protein
VLSIHWIRRAAGSGLPELIDKIATGAVSVDFAAAQAKSLWMSVALHQHPRPDGFQIVDRQLRVLMTEHP